MHGPYIWWLAPLFFSLLLKTFPGSRGRIVRCEVSRRAVIGKPEVELVGVGKPRLGGNRMRFHVRSSLVVRELIWRKLSFQEQHEHSPRLIPAIAVHYQTCRPVIFHPQAAIDRTAEYVVAHVELRRLGRVRIEHKVAAVRVRPLQMAPAVARVDARVVLKKDVVRCRLGAAVPVPVSYTHLTLPTIYSV